MTATTPEKKSAARAKTSDKSGEAKTGGVKSAAKTAGVKNGTARKRVPSTVKSAGLSRGKIREWSALSPFELKGELIALAADAHKKSSAQLLNAGRGNPNWVATGPREAFLALGAFALQESRRVWTMDNLGGMPEVAGSAVRFDRFCLANPGMTGVRLLRDMVDYGVTKLKFDADAWIGELTDAWIGDHYPDPPRVLDHCQEVVRAYLAEEMYGGSTPGTVDVFATEGGTAAMCYLFDTLVTNGILHRGDTIALMTPIFTPYIEIPELERYSFDVVHVKADMMTEEGVHMWRYPDSEVDRLADPKVKALMLVNPSNPPSMALSDRVRDRIADIVKTKNPDLAVITDDVYGTFVPGFRSLAAACPRNTALVYSYSKHYGSTGHRLGVISVAEDNVFDQLLAKLPKAKKEELNQRYRTLTLHPEKVKFIDRLVADSRSVALNHTAGLSTPQQTMIMLLSLFDLLPEGQEYKELLRTIVHRRLDLLMEGIGVHHISEDPGRACYYVELDILAEAEAFENKEFADYLEQTYEPTDVVFRLAHQASVVLLNGGGFDGPGWSVRVSLANLDDLDYLKIGHHLHSIMEEYKEEWLKTKK
ncbi:bifunctional aspartate transaminase/aspartate 4-decarboxylase [Catenulispora sp. NL8]|uniref:Bifunctional aspartate transaminase/aspartate 4-decarboxylase n=1 Tax=Catenulispora pinistramenti TaxID=2705254 RepID=A0ABS5L010_9ACTN|nr:bifunctional aspartate transaminase/aspartate 4-decarboxylase [Catenulispora pinistramenti]MBS2551658.1 bifunctional aspartate transaminase/aspartate 4-decarboxylase [Catenulispora pinistramenti]